MRFYKLFICFTMFIFLFTLPIYADDEDLENLDVIANLLDTSSEIVTEPTINSRAAIVYERSTGTILYSKNENEKRKMASTTKIMTAIVVIENADLNDIVTVSSKAAGTAGSRLGLHTDDNISVQNLLYGLLLCSGNDAAVALAEYVGGNVSGFISLMNSKASELGLQSTHFVTPHGLDDDNHYTTPYELALITDYALNNETFCNFVKTKNCTITINNRSKNISNTNELLGSLEGVYGVKTGFTNGANRCLVTAVKRDNMDIICIVLGADTKKDRTRDSIELIEYAFSNFEMVNLKEKVLEEFNNWKQYNSSSFIVEKGTSNNVDISLNDFPYEYFPLNCNNLNSLSIYIYCNTKLKAPLNEGEVIGYISVSSNNKNILTLNLRTSNFIDKKSYLDYYKALLQSYTYYLESLIYNK